MQLGKQSTEKKHTPLTQKLQLTIEKNFKNKLILGNIHFLSGKVKISCKLPYFPFQKAVSCLYFGAQKVDISLQKQATCQKRILTAFPHQQQTTFHRSRLEQKAF
eukprot:TRINITY_DN7530_c1_g2_i1.p6 TRINITY_DN7530_c1_g2~~TRINITY_DN7530_c1_g2_i1.p6  ORF type:complete len:105 (-),score=0.91 TRINITY_DN7530_c1_g2_i1:558-872(-)